MPSPKACVLGNCNNVSDQYIKAPLKSAWCDGLVQAPVSLTLRSVQIAKEIVHGVTANWDGNWGSECK